MPFLEEQFPHLVPLYKARYKDRAFLPEDYQKRISTLVTKLCRKYGIGVRKHETEGQGSGRAASRQLSLFAGGGQRL
jgi:hypothetical protein